MSLGVIRDRPTDLGGLNDFILLTLTNTLRAYPKNLIAGHLRSEVFICGFNSHIHFKVLS
jgi:hypothetical protein